MKHLSVIYSVGDDINMYGESADPEEFLLHNRDSLDSEFGQGNWMVIVGEKLPDNVFDCVVRNGELVSAPRQELIRRKAVSYESKKEQIRQMRKLRYMDDDIEGMLWDALESAARSGTIPGLSEWVKIKDKVRDELPYPDQDNF